MKKLKIVILLIFIFISIHFIINYEICKIYYACPVLSICQSNYTNFFIWNVIPFHMAGDLECFSFSFLLKAFREYLTDII